MKKYLLLILTVILAFSLTNVYAYVFTVSGTITVIETEETVPGHEVYIYALDSMYYNYFMATRTNEEGEYLFEIELEDGVYLDFMLQTISNCDSEYYYHTQVNSESLDTIVDFALCAPDANEDCYAMFHYEYINETGDHNPYYVTNIVQFHDCSYGDVMEWTWDFGDGTTSNEQNPLHEFDTENDYYEVSLSILTTDSCSGIYTEYIYVSDEWSDCYADFYYYYAFDDSNTWGNTRVFNNIQFIDMSYGEIDNWYWNFGDGTISTEQNPFHEYPNTEAMYNVRLDVATADSCFSMMEQLVYIFADTVIDYEDCYADFFYSYVWDTIDPAGNIYEENIIQFWDYSYGDVIEWNWDFGDGTMSNEQNPLHVYPDEEGIYNVTLSINTSDTCSSTYSDVVYVDYWDNDTIWYPEGCQAMFFYFYAGDSVNWPDEGDVDFNKVQFYDYSYGDVMQWYWDFGDGANSYEQHPYHEYSDIDEEYWVTLTITTRDSCVSIAENLVYTSGWWENDSVDFALTVDTIYADPVYSCAFDFDAGFDAVYIESFEIIDERNVTINWIFWQSEISFILPVNYSYIEEGMTVVSLTIFCVEEGKDGLRTVTVTDVINIKSGSSVLNGMEEMEESLTLYPNPVSDEINIEYMLEKSANVELSVINTTGQEVLYRLVESNMGTNKLTINADYLPKGVYLLKISVDNEFSTARKFVK